MLAAEAFNAEEFSSIIVLLSEFVGACCTGALSVEQRTFLSELIEIAAVRLLHCTTGMHCAHTAPDTAADLHRWHSRPPSAEAALRGACLRAQSSCALHCACMHSDMQAPLVRVCVTVLPMACTTPPAKAPFGPPSDCVRGWMCASSAYGRLGDAGGVQSPPRVQLVQL